MLRLPLLTTALFAAGLLAAEIALIPQPRQAVAHPEGKSFTLAWGCTVGGDAPERRHSDWSDYECN